jgi:hypothetical protein
MKIIGILYVMHYIYMPHIEEQLGAESILILKDKQSH